MSERSEGERIRDAGFDEWLGALERGEAYFLECPHEHGSLPPRRVCPDCGATDLDDRTLPESGEIVTYTVTHIPTPSFEEDAPYVTAIADFGPVRLTGQVVGIEPEAVETGIIIEPDVHRSETSGDRVVVLRAR